MQTKKRKKVTRQRGSHTHGRGFMKKARGKGHRGGVGNSGSGKKADQKKNTSERTFGKSKTLRRGQARIKVKTINLSKIQDLYSGEKKINLEGYKILGQGSLDFKTEITAHSASASALEKLNKAGSKLILEVSQEPESSKSEETSDEE